MMRALVVTCVGLLLVACGSSQPGQSPESAVEAFLTAIDDQDCALMRAIVLTPSEFDCGLMGDYGELMGDLGPDTADIAEKSRAGTSAVVTVTWPSGSSDFEVEQVQGSWKVNLDTPA